MNDRYLFKAKRIDNGEWIIGNLIQSPFMGTVRSWISSESEDKERLGSITCNSYKAEWRSIEVQTDSVCQCTGLKDKNGNLIFDNDIVKDDKGNLYKAFWQNKYYQFSWICIKSNFLPVGAKWDLWSFKSYEIEVIDSIFDNPELLEVE